MTRGLIKMLFFIGFVFVVLAVILFMTEEIVPAVVCLVLGLIFGAISESAKERKRKKAEEEARRAYEEEMARRAAEEEAARRAQEKSSGGIFGFIFRVTWGIVTLPFKIIGWCFSDKGGESSADRYAREAREYYAKDTANYQANQRKKQELLSRANQLEQQARYGMPYEQKRLKQEAEELRRQANRL